MELGDLRQRLYDLSYTGHQLGVNNIDGLAARAFRLEGQGLGAHAVRRPKPGLAASLNLRVVPSPLDKAVPAATATAMFDAVTKPPSGKRKAEPTIDGGP